MYFGQDYKVFLTIIGRKKADFADSRDLLNPQNESEC